MRFMSVDVEISAQPEYSLVQLDGSARCQKAVRAPLYRISMTGSCVESQFVSSRFSLSIVPTLDPGSI